MQRIRPIDAVLCYRYSFRPIHFFIYIYFNIPKLKAQYVRSTYTSSRLDEILMKIILTTANSQNERTSINGSEDRRPIYEEHMFFA